MRIFRIIGTAEEKWSILVKKTPIYGWLYSVAILGKLEYKDILCSWLSKNFRYWQRFQNQHLMGLMIGCDVLLIQMIVKEVAQKYDLPLLRIPAITLMSPLSFLTIFLSALRFILFP